MMISTLLVILSFVLMSLVDVNLLMVLVPLWGIAFFILSVLRDDSKQHFRWAYTICFSVGLIYIALCQLYMSAYNYEYLLAYDTIDVFLPRLEDFMSGSRSYGDTLKNIWDDYSFWDRFQVGYYSFIAFWATIANNIDADLYATLQIGTVFTCSFIVVLLCRILQLNGIDSSVGRKYAMLISILSPILLYSTVILRDGLIALVYVYLIYICHKQFSWTNVIKIIIASYVCTTLRIETGLFAFVFIPFYFCINWEYIRHNVLAILLFIIVVTGVVFVIMTYMSSIMIVAQANYEYYSEDVSEGTGIIGMLQRIPILGPVLSIFYTFLTPMPCWRRLNPEYWFDGWPEVYNVMQFPTIISALFHFYLVFYLSSFVLAIKPVKNTYKGALKWLVLFALLFLLIQSAIVTQRRILGAYVIFYLVWAITHNKNESSYNRKILNISLICFVLLQIVAFIY